MVRPVGRASASIILEMSRLTQGVHVVNKKELVARVSGRTDTGPGNVADVLDATLQEITDALANGDRVQLVGFGTFRVASSPARMGRNPSTGEPIEVKARNRAVFKAGSKLQGAVAGDG